MAQLENSPRLEDTTETSTAAPGVVAPQAPDVRLPSCENCGRETSGEDVANNTALCRRCRGRFTLYHGLRIALSWVLVFGLLIFVIPALLRPYETAAGANARFLAFYGALIVGMFVHETAHALAARRLGLRVVEVRFGTGPVVWHRLLHGARVQVHLLPFGGLTRWRAGTSVTALRQRAIVAAAGPVSNLLLAALCWSLRASAPAILIPAACANLATFIDNLVPDPNTKTGQGNDGWQVVKNLRPTHWATTHQRRVELTERCTDLSRAGREAEVRDYLLAEIERAGGDAPDAEALLCILLLSPKSSREQLAEGFDRSAKLLTDRRAFPVLRAMALNNRAYCLALGGWPALMQEAEWAARDALRRLPDNPEILSTLALVLVRLGRFGDAEPIAARAAQDRVKTMGAASGDALVSAAAQLATTRCVLGLVYAHTARHEAAERELVQARSLDASCELLGELERVLAGEAQAVATGEVPAASPRAAAAAPAAADALPPPHDAQDEEPPPRIVALPLFLEVAGLLAIALAGIAVVTGSVPASLSQDGLVSYHVSAVRLIGVLGALAVMVLALACTIDVTLRPPRAGRLGLTPARRRCAQAGPLLSLVVISPLMLLALQAGIAHGSPSPILVGYALAVAIGDVAAVRVLRRGLLRMRRRELGTACGSAVTVCLLPFLVTSFVVSTPARQSSWRYFWVADTTGFSRAVDGLTCTGSGSCAEVIVSRSFGARAQALEFATLGTGGWSRPQLFGTRMPLSWSVSLACSDTLRCDVSTGRARRILRTDDGGASWRSLAGPDIEHGLACPDALTCYGVGVQRVKVSHDGGETWAPAGALPRPGGHRPRPRGIVCVSSATCLVFGGAQGQPLLAVTANAGTSWQSRAPSGLADVSGLSCPAATTCYAVGQPAVRGSATAATPLQVMRSNDLGRSWTTLRVPAAGSFSPTISCADAADCMLVSDTYFLPNIRTTALTTNDGGASWNAYPAPGGGAALPQHLACAATGCRFVLSGGSYEAVASTADGGRSWTTIVPPFV